MRYYKAPELKITLFDNHEDVMCASNTENETVTSTKQEVTGDGPGIVLPDDEW